jgi:hypothetical protein
MAKQEMDLEVSFEKRFGWYVVINRISNGDITKHSIIFSKNVIEILNQLVYLIEYDKEQVRLQKQALQNTK